MSDEPRKAKSLRYFFTQPNEATMSDEQREKLLQALRKAKSLGYVPEFDPDGVDQREELLRTLQQAKSLGYVTLPMAFHVEVDTDGEVVAIESADTPIVVDAVPTDDAT